MQCILRNEFNGWGLYPEQMGVYTTREACRFFTRTYLWEVTTRASSIASWSLKLSVDLFAHFVKALRELKRGEHDKQMEGAHICNSPFPLIFCPPCPNCATCLLIVRTQKTAQMRYIKDVCLCFATCIWLPSGRLGFVGYSRHYFLCGVTHLKVALWGSSVESGRRVMAAILRPDFFKLLSSTFRARVILSIT